MNTIASRQDSQHAGIDDDETRRCRRRDAPVSITERDWVVVAACGIERDEPRLATATVTDRAGSQYWCSMTPGLTRHP